MIDLAALPSWVLPLAAAAGWAAILGTLYWIMPTAVRRTPDGWSPLLAAAGYVAVAAGSGWSRGTLWFAAVGWLAVVPPLLLLLGRLPDDLPSARDPRVRLHPQYAEVAARGRRAGVVIVVLVVLLMIGTITSVRGL